MSICMSTCLSTCLYTCLPTLLNTCLHTRIYTCPHTLHTCLHTRLYTCPHTCLRICLHTRLCVDVHTHTYTSTHMSMHLFTRISIRKSTRKPPRMSVRLSIHMPVHTPTNMSMHMPRHIPRHVRTYRFQTAAVCLGGTSCSFLRSTSSRTLPHRSTSTALTPKDIRHSGPSNHHVVTSPRTSSGLPFSLLFPVFLVSPFTWSCAFLFLVPCLALFCVTWPLLHSLYLSILVHSCYFQEPGRMRKMSVRCQVNVATLGI